MGFNFVCDKSLYINVFNKVPQISSPISKLLPVLYYFSNKNCTLDIKNQILSSKFSFKKSFGALKSRGPTVKIYRFVQTK